MDEREKLEGADNPVHPDERDNSRLIGEIVAEFVSSLGSDQAIMPGSLVMIGRRRVDGCTAALSVARPSRDEGAGRHDDTPRNSASLCEQRARPHVAHRAIRSK